MKHQMMIPKVEDMLEVTILDFNSEAPIMDGFSSYAGGISIPSKSLHTINQNGILDFGYKKFEFEVVDEEDEEGMKKYKEDVKAFQKEMGVYTDDSEEVEIPVHMNRPMGIMPATRSRRPTPPMKKVVIECTQVMCFPSLLHYIDMPYQEFKELYTDFLERKNSVLD